MDASLFGLNQRPFPTTPDTTCYYPATSHERVLARLLAGLSDSEGVMVLTGAPGTGKTLLCHCLPERLGPEQAAVFLTNSHFRDRMGLLQAILFDLSLPYVDRGEQEMRLSLTEHLLKHFGDGRSTVLLIDEAHHLTPDLLEELRLLGNLEGRSGRALQVVLVGQAPLLNTLRHPDLAALWQRLAIRVELEPLDVQEAADYLLHHIRVAGSWSEEVFSTEALELLARASGGVPRLLNQAARQALAIAREAEAEQVDAESALEALALLGLHDEPVSLVGPAEETPGIAPILTPDVPAEATEESVPRGEAACRLFITPQKPA